MEENSSGAAEMGTIFCAVKRCNGLLNPATVS